MGREGAPAELGGHLASLMWLLPFILQFKYGVLEGRLFSGFYKEGRTNGQRGGRFSLFSKPLFHTLIFSGKHSSGYGSGA